MIKSNAKIYSIIGIGNPDTEYKDTYHNAGKLFIRYAISNYNENFSDMNAPSHKHFKYIKTGKTIFAESKTYMNMSGLATYELIKYFKQNIENILVVHDDSDILIGSYKLAFNQSSGGHKGVQSIVDSVGSQSFWRLKIGIRQKKEIVRKKSEEFVLKNINKKDMQILNDVFSVSLKEIQKHLE